MGNLRKRIVRRQNRAAGIAEYLAHSFPFERCPDNLRAREPGFSMHGVIELLGGLRSAGRGATRIPYRGVVQISPALRHV